MAVQASPEAPNFSAVPKALSSRFSDFLRATHSVLAKAEASQSLDCSQIPNVINILYQSDPVVNEILAARPGDVTTLPEGFNPETAPFLFQLCLAAFLRPANAPRPDTAISSHLTHPIPNTPSLLPSTVPRDLPPPAFNSND